MARKILNPLDVGGAHDILADRRQQTSRGQAERWEISAEDGVKRVSIWRSNRERRCRNLPNGGGAGTREWVTAEAPPPRIQIARTMSKLRKDPPRVTSRTLAIATGVGHDNQEHTQRDIQPRTGVEQYWAARALKAETALSARETHQLEVQHLRDSEETKRFVRL